MASAVFNLGRRVRDCCDYRAAGRSVMRRALCLVLLAPALSFAADCDPTALAGLSTTPTYAHCLNSDCSQRVLSKLSDAEKGQIARDIYALNGDSLPPSGTLTYEAGFVMWFKGDAPRYQPVGDPKFGCSYGGTDATQPEPVQSFPIPGAADVKYSDNPPLKTIFDRNGGPGLTDLYAGDPTDFYRYFLLEAPDWDPGNGGSVRPNSCSNPANQDPILGVGGSGDFAYVTCASASDNKRYILYREKIPKTCDRYPGYQMSAGACSLFYESAVKKPAGKLSCETVQRGNRLAPDPRNPDCAAKIREISETELEVPLSGGDDMRVKLDPDTDNIRVDFPSGGGSGNRDYVDFGPYDPGLGGRPVIGTGGGGGAGGGGTGGGTGGGGGDGSGGGGGGTGGGTEPDWGAMAPDGDLLAGLRGPLGGWLNFSADLPTGSCPVAEFDALNRHYLINQHCELLEQQRGTLAAVMIAAWTLLAAGIVLRA